MITYKIYKEKPAVVAHTAVVPWSDPGAIRAHNQEELTAVIEKSGVKIGDFYVYASTTVHSLACIHCVVNIERDFSKVPKRFALPEVTPFYLMQVDKWSPSAYRWLRWENLKHLRPISDQEYNLFVRGQLDYIQNYCQPHFPKDFKLVPR